MPLSDRSARGARARRIPLIVVVNAATALALVALLEVALRVTEPRSDTVRTDRIGDHLEPHRTLGYLGTPRGEGRSVSVLGGDTVVDYGFRFDSLGWRVVPRTDRRDRFVLFAGDSFTFGLGLSDTEHLAAVVEARQPDYAAYSASHNGWGPAQFVALMEGAAPLGIAQDTGVAVFGWIGPHADRAVGAFYNWDYTADFPAYLREGDSVAYRGSLAEAHPVRARLFGALRSSLLARKIGRKARGVDSDPELSGLMLRQACRRFAERYISLGCYVILWPGAGMGAVRPDVPGLEVIDLRDLYDRNDLRYSLDAADRHPSAEAVRIMADTLVTLLLP